MYGCYGDIISACEKRLAEYDKLRERLEYPEVQADRSLYVHTLKRFSELDALKKHYDAFIAADREQQTVYRLLGETDSDEEKTYYYGELTALKAARRDASRAMALLLGVKGADENVLCRIISPTKRAADIAGELASLMRLDLAASGCTAADQSADIKNGVAAETRFTAHGTGAYGRLAAVCGTHRIISGGKGEYISVGAVQRSDSPTIDENELKITLFHSSGAGGQNVNKVETAVRVTHEPTGLTVVCQDERSQLRNKERAVQTIKKRLADRYAEAEKKRIDLEFSAMFERKNSMITFNATERTVSDARLSAFCRRFPMSAEEYTSYIDALITTVRS